jgi:thiosulfate/3-mercaptopyruvate sulfurtransferase
VSPDWLAARLADENLVILHVGAAPDYEAGHIPGASLVELGRISVTSDPGLCVEVPPVEKLREELSRLGIGDQSQIVLYAGTASYQSMTRVFFTLDYIGAGDRASILDGGLALWWSEGRPLSKEATPAAPASLTIRPRPELVVDAEWIQDNTGEHSVIVLDARTPEFYTGASIGRMQRAGHIPVARNIPFTTIVEASGKFRSREELERMFRDAGVEPSATVVAYCLLAYKQQSCIGLRAR